MFHFIITFFKNWSDMFETRGVVVSISLFSLVAASFCIYQAQTEDKVGHHSKVKGQGPCEDEYQNYSLNSGECSYPSDEDIVGCNCT